MTLEMTLAEIAFANRFASRFVGFCAGSSLVIPAAAKRALRPGPPLR
jgi:hypothetical protein